MTGSWLRCSPPQKPPARTPLPRFTIPAIASSAPTNALKPWKSCYYTALVAETLWLPPKEEVFKKLKLDSNPDKAADELKARAALRGLTENRLRSTRNAHFSK